MVKKKNSMNRTFWMFPRCKRETRPAEMGLFIRALSNTLADATDSNIDQLNLNSLNSTLNSLKLKNGAPLQVNNSGGMRTYISMCSQLGLVFDRDKKKNTLKGTYLTLAGLDLAELNDPASVMVTQVLRMQFPCEYSQSLNVRIHSSVKVQPAIFLAKMAESKKLNYYISSEDIAIAVIYGRTMKDLNKVIKKCQKARKYYHASIEPDKNIKRLESIKSVIDNEIVDLFSVRMKQKAVDNKINNIIAIGNTLINRMKSAGILLVKLESLSDYETIGLVLNQSHKSEIDIIKKDGIISLQAHTSTEGWQRRLGRGRSTKDTRKYVTCKKYPLSSPPELFKNDILSEYNQYGALFDVDDFCKSYSTKMGKSILDLRKIVDKVLPNTKGDNERQLIETGSDIKRHRDFEINITHYLRNAFSKADVTHVGQKTRLDKTKTRHNFADVVYHSSNHSIIQIDAKALSGKSEYKYDATESGKSEDYVRYPDEIFSHKHDKQECFIIISPRFSINAYKHAADSEERTKVPFKLINIHQLIELVDGAKSNDVNFVSDILAH